MASNQRKEEIRIEWQTNYNEAINNINQVKSSLSDNAYEVDKLEQSQFRLNAEYKKFEKTLNEVGNEIDSNEVANNELTKAIEKLSSRIDNASVAISEYKSHLDSVKNSGDSLKKSTDDVAHSVESTATKTDELSDSTNKLKSSMDDVGDTSKQSEVLFQRLDEVTFGLSSNIRDLVLSNQSAKTAITGNADAFATMSTKAKVATVATNGFKIALKSLMIGTGILALVLAIGHIAENWEEILKTTRSAFSETYKLKQLELERLAKSKEQINVIDGQTERLKEQGFSEIEIAKKRLLAQQQRTSAILQEIKIRRADEANSFSFLQHLEVQMNKIVGTAQTIAGKIAQIIGFSQWGDKMVEKGETNYWSEFDVMKLNKNEFDKSEDGKALNAELEASKEAEAGIRNSIKSMRAGSGSNADDIKQKTEDLRNTIKQYVLDIAKLNADNLTSKQHAEWAQREYDIEQKRIASLKQVKELHKEGTAQYESNAKIINELHDLELQSITDEQDAYKQTNLLFFELQSNLDSGNLTIEQKKIAIDDFISTIENADVKDEFAKLLNIDTINSAISAFEQFKDSIADYATDESLSFSENADKLSAIRDFNNSLLVEERRAFEASAEYLEYTEEEKAKIKEKFNKQSLDNESNYNNASRELNQKRGEQISDYADLASEGLSKLGEMMNLNFDQQKAFSAAGALIDTFSSINRTLSAFSGMPIPGYAIAQSIATGVFGFMQVASILATEPESVASGASMANVANMEGARNQPNVQFHQSAESQLAQTIGAQQNTPIKTYVTVKDINSAQELERNNKNNSSL